MIGGKADYVGLGRLCILPMLRHGVFLSYSKFNKEIYMAKNTSCKAMPAIVQPKRLSKAGEWLKKHPKGLGVTINDMRAVMR